MVATRQTHDARKMAPILHQSERAALLGRGTAFCPGAKLFFYRLVSAIVPG